MAGQLIPTTHIPLALRGQADSISGVEESCHPHIGSIQYSSRQMVCQHHWFPGLRRLQAMVASWDFQRRWPQENPRQCIHSLRKYPGSLDVPLELHQWNVQRHQTRWTRNHWSARSTHQNVSRQVWLHVSRREDATPTGATLSCDQTLRS